MKRSEMICTNCVYVYFNESTEDLMYKLNPVAVVKWPNSWCGQGMWQEGWDEKHKLWDNYCWGEWEKEEGNNGCA
jgi:hypothetical protein